MHDYVSVGVGVVDSVYDRYLMLSRDWPVLPAALRLDFDPRCEFLLTGHH